MHGVNQSYFEISKNARQVCLKNTALSLCIKKRELNLEIGNPDGEYRNTAVETCVSVVYMHVCVHVVVQNHAFTSIKSVWHIPLHSPPSQS